MRKNAKIGTIVGVAGAAAVLVVALLLILPGTPCACSSLTFTETANITCDPGHGSVSSQPVYDGTYIVISAETNHNISVRKYDLDLNPVGPAVEIANKSDTNGEEIADHKHIFQNNHHYIAFANKEPGADDMYLVKFDKDFNRVKNVTVVQDDAPTNDMLLVGNGTYVYVGKFAPQLGKAHVILAYDADLNWYKNYTEGAGPNSHANGDAAYYKDGKFYFVSPQHVGPGSNSYYFLNVYDSEFNSIVANQTILYEESKLGVVNGLSYYGAYSNSCWIVHYNHGNENNIPTARAIYDCDWNLIKNETVYTSPNMAPHTVIVGNALYLGYSNSSGGFKAQVGKFVIS